MIRTRFAPSPTGFQHIGGFRTAIYAWLFARRYGGSFILRIEDTDRERLVAGATRYLIESLQWLGMDVDEGPSLQELKQIGEYWEGAPEWGGEVGPYVQSLRAEIYREFAAELIAKGAAYRCDCTAEMLAAERQEQMARKTPLGYSGRCRDRNVPEDVPHVVRLRIPDHLSLTLHDAVRGEIKWENPSLKDTVLLKSDGLPTYHLASVVDDHLMRISHVMRGEEWLATTPLHLILYRAFGWEPPLFCHLSQVLGRDGKKLSKRHGAEALTVLKDAGYLPEAIMNYVVLIGWSPGEGDDQEIFSREELKAKFSLERLNSAGGIFDSEKLLWMNGMYIRALSVERFTALAKPFIERAGLEFDSAAWDVLAPHIQERAKLLGDVPGMVDFLFRAEIERDLDAILKQGGDISAAITILDRSYQVLNGLNNFEPSRIEAAMKEMVAASALKPGSVFGIVRIAVTGKKVSPPLFESISALGRERTLRRIEETKSLLAK